VVEAVVLAAECDLLLDSRDGDLVAGINDLDWGWQPACGPVAGTARLRMGRLA
jgi:hypothetical protein